MTIYFLVGVVSCIDVVADDRGYQPLDSFPPLYCANLSYTSGSDKTGSCAATIEAYLLSYGSEIPVWYTAEPHIYCLCSPEYDFHR